VSAALHMRLIAWPLVATGLAVVGFGAAQQVKSQTAPDAYVQAGDEPQSQYFGHSRDGNRAVKASDTNHYEVEVWDPIAHTRISSIKSLAGAVNVANISPDGSKVVTAERNGIVGVWDAQTGKQLMLLRGHKDQIHDVRFSPDGTVIASGARDGTARTWDAATGAQIAVHQQRGGPYVDAVSFSPDGRWVLSAGNGWAQLWSATTGEDGAEVGVGPPNKRAFATLARLSPDGTSIIVTNWEGSITGAFPIEVPGK